MATYALARDEMDFCLKRLKAANRNITIGTVSLPGSPTSADKVYNKPENKIPNATAMVKLSKWSEPSLSTNSGAKTR